MTDLMDKLQELVTKWESSRKIESHDGYNAGYNDGRARAAAELRQILEAALKPTASPD